MPTRFKVEIAAKAQSDIKAIHAFIAQDKPRAAAMWERAIRRQWKSLGQYPRRYEVIGVANDREYRHVIYGNYRTIYRIEDQVVHVVRVVHSAQEFTPDSS